MKIIKLTAENFKKLVAVEITPDGNVVTISGKNAAGKSSVLDAIVSALGGAAKAPAKPVREGQQQATVVVETEDYIVRRRFTKAGTTLEVRRTNHSKIKAPQELLDRITGQIAFDPLAFARMKDREQRDMLLALLGLDLSEHDEKIAALRTERNTLLAEKKRLADQAERLQWIQNVPKKEVSIGQLTARLKAANSQNENYETYERVIAERAGKLAQLQQQLDDLQRRIEEEQHELAGIETDFASMTRADAESIEGAMATVEETNRNVRSNQEYLDAAEGMDQLAEHIRTKHHEIEAAEGDKTRAVAAVTMPVPGLGIDENGVLLDDIPFVDVNHAKQVEVSVAIAMAMNPELRILLVDGNGLDTESLAAIASMADDKDYQIWLERTDETGEVGFYIEDGSLAGKAQEGESA